ncbi:MAG TPA: hypothetical protein VGL80_24125 [Pseudonocardiaceae bacterium]
MTAIAVTITAGSAVATASLADGAAAPVVIGSCATSVKGDPGTPVELSPSAVLSPVVDIVQTLDPLNLLTPGFRSAFAALPPIPIGALPTGTGTITGGQIANAVTAQLNKIPLLGPILTTLTGKVRSTLASMCQVTVTGVNAVTAPVQNGTSAIASASQKAAQKAGIVPQSGGTPAGGGSTPGKTGTTGGGSGGSPVKQGGGGGSSSGSGLPAPNSPVLGGLPPGLGAAGATFGAGTLLDYGLAESPLARYAGIPFASAGLFDPAPGVKYGGDVPGYAPSSGQLGQNDVLTPDGVQTAGHAEALNPGGTLGNGVGLPMLLAVLLLAGVTAALVRTWVLRKVRVA